MGYSEEKCRQLFEALMKMGFHEAFCEAISRQLCTEWTANRMLSYLKQVSHLREEDVADEMLSILSDRDQIKRKKEHEFFQQKINEMYMNENEDETNEDE